jgi:putative endonuclease
VTRGSGIPGDDIAGAQAAPSPERSRRYRRGLSAEFVAALYLRAKGYRVLARRHRTPLGEIDLVAARGRRLAFVEVKRRASLADAEASITPRQRTRIRRASDLWLARHPRYREHEIGFDLVFLLPWRWPIHIVGGL